jgi:fibronectin type 3 domain-containing protein
MAHSVSLSWTASIDVPADSYNVYRGTASGQETDLLNTSPITGTTFVDSAPLTGTSFYAVKSVANGVESIFSNEVSAVILPAPPTNLVLVSAS